MAPNSFLTEWCFQALTERMTLTRLELWHRLQSATDIELARQITPSSFAYTLDDVASVVGDIRTANAGDLGEFALFALGLGSVPLRPADLTEAQRDKLIQMELIAQRTSSDASAITELKSAIAPTSAGSFQSLAKKYNVSESHVAALAKKDREGYSQTPQGAPLSSKLPSLVVHTRDTPSDSEQATESGRRMAQVSRLLGMR